MDCRNCRRLALWGNQTADRGKNIGRKRSSLLGEEVSMSVSKCDIQGDLCDQHNVHFTGWHKYSHSSIPNDKRKSFEHFASISPKSMGSVCPPGPSSLVIVTIAGVGTATLSGRPKPI